MKKTDMNKNDKIPLAISAAVRYIIKAPCDGHIRRDTGIKKFLTRASRFDNIVERHLRGATKHRTARQEKLEREIQSQAEVPKWLKGLPWKGSRSLVTVRGFKSLLLRSLRKISEEP